MGFNSGFKGLSKVFGKCTQSVLHSSALHFSTHRVSWWFRGKVPWHCFRRVSVFHG